MYFFQFMMVEPSPLDQRVSGFIDMLVHRTPLVPNSGTSMNANFGPVGCELKVA